MPPLPKTKENVQMESKEAREIRGSKLEQIRIRNMLAVISGMIDHVNATLHLVKLKQQGKGC